MSNGTPACSVGAVDARWLFPQERAPSSSPRKTRLDDCDDLLASALASHFDRQDAKMNALMVKINALIARQDASLERSATLKALRARPGIAPSVHIPSSTTTWMSSPTAAGSTLRIEEVCTQQDAHLEASLADFRLFADDLDLRQPSTHASFASLDDNDDDHDKDKAITDKAIPIVRSIDDADVEFEDIAVVLASPPPLPYMDAVMPFLGGEFPMSSPNMLSAFESATVPPQKTAC
jgi:hypothetical protein